MPRIDLLIPAYRCVARRGLLRLPDRAVLAGPCAADVLPLRQLAGDLEPLGVRARVDRSAFGPAAVRIRRHPSAGPREAYRLTVSAGGAEIVASADAGAYYGVQTLRDLVGVGGRDLPACAIDDRPDFARRGVYLDCSRGKVPALGRLTSLVEQLARWKVNELQLYVENVFTFRRHPAIGRGFSPFTPQELLVLQDHCRLHHVRLVPSPASFGHMEKVLALPAYRRLGELPGFRGLPGGTTLCPGDGGSIRLVRELYEEFLPLFEADDVNVCCDETWELGKGRSRRRAARVGVGRLYLEFLLKIHRLCARHGKRMNAWADIALEHPELLGELPRDIVMLNWDYHPRGRRIPRTREIADAGLPRMVCPGTNAWNSHGCRLRMGMANIARFAEEGLRRGAEGLLNTDWGDGGHRNMLAVSLHNLAWGAACSWRRRAARADGFTDRFCRRLLGRADQGFVRAVRTLGCDGAALRLPYANSTVLYHVLVGRSGDILRSRSLCEQLDGFSSADLHAHADALRELRWPAAPKGGGVWLRHCLAEYRLAAELDRVACRRAILLKALRAGAAPHRAQARRLAADLRRLAERLKRVWLLGNKPSRLRDRLRELRQAQRELR